MRLIRIMQIFTYTAIFKFIFRFANIIITLLLLLFLIPAAGKLDEHIVYFAPFLLTIAMIYFINKHYLSTYKIIPYKIQANGEKIICSDYLFSQKTVTLYYNDITELQGGIFDGKITGLMLIKDGRNNRTIGFYSKIKHAKQLETLILSKVPTPVYDKVVDRVAKIERENNIGSDTK
jgi:hypothetical protein